jgi:hypothetical protein
VDFRFVAPSLRELDLATAELLACCIWSDVRPMQGLAGILDFRLAGKLSGLARDRFLGGAEGEVVLVPGKPSLPFEKVLVFGLGKASSFTDRTFQEIVGQVSRALERLHVVRAVIELPGRADGSITPERAAELLVPSVSSDAHDAWWLVEDLEGQRRMAPKLVEDRRRIRRM